MMKRPRRLVYEFLAVWGIAVAALILGHWLGWIR